MTIKFKKYMRFTYKKDILAGGILLILFAVLFFIRLYNNNGIGGDQVHYLVMTHSFLEDYDFDLKNDYQTKRYDDYWSDELDPHIPVRQFGTENPKWYSLHNPGLPIIISPLVKFFGNQASILFMTLVSLLTLVLTYNWTARVTKNKWAGLLGAGAILTSVFFIALNGYLFPNLLSAVLFLGAFLLLETKNPSRFQLALLGLILGIGPWIHVKVLLSFATIGIIAVIQLLLIKKAWGKKIKDLLALSLPSLILVGLFEWKLYQWYAVVSGKNFQQ